MKWVTSEGVHLDRVATPWLIKRFIDPEAEFFFVAAGGQPDAEAIPFALPGAKLSPYDEGGSTFRKVIDQYEIADPALDYLAGMLEAGIDYVLRPSESYAEGAASVYPEGAGLNAFSEGMVYSGKDDHSILVQSELFYDALYIYCRAKVIEMGLSPDMKSRPLERLQTLKRLIASTAL